MFRSIRHKQLLWVALVALVAASCRPTTTSDRSTAKWGIRNDGATANILNLKPNQSLAICAPNQEWQNAIVSGVEQWATAIGRWGYFKVTDCNSPSDLLINIVPSNSLGLNYLNAVPGRIELLSTSTGNMLKALALHEVGHSYGLCDQYADGAAVGCSSTGTRADNNEVMGATSANKLKLTAGDIAGVQAAANLNTRANAEWKSFLASKPTKAANQVFAQILEQSNGTQLQISIPDYATPTLRLMRGNASTEVSLSRLSNQTVTGRIIYQTTDLPSLSVNESNVFVTELDIDGEADKPVSKFAVKQAQSANRN